MVYTTGGRYENSVALPTTVGFPVVGAKIGCRPTLVALLRNSLLGTLSQIC